MDQNFLIFYFLVYISHRIGNKILIIMHGTHHFLIDDQDSLTNFSLSSMPVRFACGYNFCDASDASTRSQNSEGSQKSQLLGQSRRSLTHAKDDLHNHTKDSQKDTYQESAIRKHLASMQQAYAQHKIDVANYYAYKLQKLCERSPQKLTIEERQLLTKVQRQARDVHHYEKILNQSGWQLQKQKKHLKVSTKMQENTVGVLVEAYLDVQIQNFLSVMIEIDLMKQWMPFMESSKLQKIVSRNCRIGHCVNNFPIIAKRQSFFQGIGYDRMEHNKTVFMFTRSLNSDKELQKQLGYSVHETEGAVQLDYKYFILQYSPDTPKTGTLRMAINVDMKLNIPMFILGPATEGFGIDFYQNVRKIAKNFSNSKWEKKIQQNSSFFDFVRKRIRQHFNQKQQSRRMIV